MQSSNPAIGVITREAGSYNFGGIDAAATLSGTTTKALIFVTVTLLAGYFSLVYTVNYIYNMQAMPTLLMYGSLIAAFVVAMITIFKPQSSPITAPIYAVLEGVALGSLSASFELRFPGIVITAVISTFVVVMVMLALWKMKIIVPTARFRSVLIGAMSAICVLYLINFAFTLFGSTLLPQTGALSIGISLIVCLVAALSLVLDFENIQMAVDRGLPKYFEYFNAFSLLVTICWLYIEILRLLSKRE